MAEVKRRFSVITSQDESLLLKVAFATDDNKHVNQHFGSAKAIAVYGVTMDSSHLLTLAEFGYSDQLDQEDKLIDKLELLDGCVAVYCRACGASAVRQLLERNIQPLKVVDDSPIKALLKAFQKELSEGPSSWLATAIKRQQVPPAPNVNDYEIEH